MRFADGSDLVNGEYVRVVEGGRGFCFLNEAADPVLVSRGLVVKYLDGDRSVEFRILSEKDLTHSAAADLADYLVAAEFLPRLQFVGRGVCE